MALRAPAPWRLAGENTVYVYPLKPSPNDELKTLDDIKVQTELQPLYDYLWGRGSFVHLGNYRPDYLPIFSRTCCAGSRPGTTPGRPWSRRKSLS